MTDGINVPDSDGKDDFTEGESYNDSEFDKIDLPEKQVRQHKNRNKRDKTMKPLGETKVGRFVSDFLSGKNKAGRIAFSIADVLPIPNVHEVVKAVLKDAEEEQREIGTVDLIKESIGRLDLMRTGIGGGLVILYLLDYISFAKVEKTFELISNFI